MAIANRASGSKHTACVERGFPAETRATSNHPSDLIGLMVAESHVAEQNYHGLYGVQPTIRDQTIRAGELALDELPAIVKEQIWDRYMRVALALEAIQSEAMFIAQINAPNGRNTRYRKAHKALIEKHRFDRIPSSSDRSRLLKCLRNRIEIESWLQTLPMNKRLKLTHPLVIFRNWEAAAHKARGHGEGKKKSSRIEELRKINVELQEENNRLRASDGGAVSSKDTARDVVRLLRGLFSESKVAEIRRLLGRETPSRPPASSFPTGKPRRTCACRSSSQIHRYSPP